MRAHNLDLHTGHDNLNVENSSPDNYSISGSKWGETQTAGITGGVVTWSIVDGGIRDLYNEYEKYGGGTTEAFGGLFAFDFVAQLTMAFKFWSDISGIQFVQVEDDGEDFTQIRTDGYLYNETNNSDIRLGANLIDGNNNTLAYGFYPSSYDLEAHGNITFDSGEDYFWNANSFLFVAAHEIGHAIGIEHSDVSGALMYPTYSSLLTGLSADDISAARAVYGDESNHNNNLYMRDNDSELRLLEDFEGLTINGTAGDDKIKTANGSITIKSGSGNDLISTGRGEDLLEGGSGNDVLKGKGGNDLLKGGSGDDSIFGYIWGKLGDTDDIDTAIYDGILADYSFALYTYTSANRSAGPVQRLIVTDSTDGGTDGVDEGRDILQDIDFLQFSDQNISILDLPISILGTSSVETLKGTKYDDPMSGLAGDDVLKGYNGSDYLKGGEGNDSLFGYIWGSNGDSDDIDTALYDGALTDYSISTYIFSRANRTEGPVRRIIVEDSESGGTDGLDEGRDTLQGINLIKFADGNIIDVDAMIFGTTGNDALNGNDANNIIIASAGADTSTGGGGNDTFYFQKLSDSTSTNKDEINDFTQGEDRIALFELNVDFSDLTITSDAGITYVKINDTDFEIALNGQFTLSQDDFII